MRRGLIGLIGMAIAALGLVVASQIGTLLPGGAAASTSSPGPEASGLGSPVVVAPTPTSTPTEPPPTPIPTPRTVPAPLTGLPVSPEAALQHPIAVMIDDNFYARPQAGFNAASVVWHAPAEGGVPRYMLVFQDQIPADVGPIRSARQYYVEWAAEWNAMYVHHGGSPQALTTLASKGHGQWVWNADGFRWEGRYLFRVRGDRFAPHNVMTDGEHLRRLATRVGADDAPITAAWTFGRAVRPSLRPVGTTIVVRYPYETITYKYDPTTNRYVRYLNESKTPQVDAADSEVVAPTNVVILRMFFGPLNDGRPDLHRLEAHNIGKGEAWISTNGRTVKGTWSKKSATGPTLLFGPDGKPFTLTAGQTFVQVLALSYEFETTDGVVPVVVPMQASHADPT